RLQFIVLLWGFTGVLGKLIQVEAVPLVWYRVLFAMAVLFVILKFRKIPLKISPKDLAMLLGIGVVIGLHWMAFFGAIKVSNVAVALSTLSTGALFSAFLEHFFFKLKIHMSEIVVVIILSNYVILVYNASPNYWFLIILIEICCIITALVTVMNIKMHAKFPS